MKNPAGHPQPQDYPIRTCTKKQLTQAYGISYYVLRKWLKSIVAETGPLTGRLINVAQLKIIYDQLGYPGEQ